MFRFTNVRENPLPFAFAPLLHDEFGIGGFARPYLSYD
jgi:hypothetical protein